MARFVKGRKSPGQGSGRDGDTLTDAQLAFVNAYQTNGFDERKALKSAGLSPNYAGKIKKYPAVQRELDRRKRLARERSQIDEDFVLGQLAMLAQANRGDILQKLRDADYDLSVLSFEERYAIAEFSEETAKAGRGEDAKEILKRKLKLHNPEGPLIALCRHLGLFNDRVTIEGEVGLVERLQAGRDRIAKQKKGD